MPQSLTGSSKQINFSSVLAAAVHDMKNSLCLLIQSIEELSHSIDASNKIASRQVADVHYEATRLNTSLVQLLSLYRAQLDNLPITVDECFVADLLADVMDAVSIYHQQKAFSVTIDCDENLSWYLDSELIYLLVNDAVINALRYGQSRIHIAAKQEDGRLCISVEDDGSGYPATMLDKCQTELAEFTLSEGRTGLGLFFARMIASAHTRAAGGNESQVKGEIILTNGGFLGGSVFMVKIP